MSQQRSELAHFADAKLKCDMYISLLSARTVPTKLFSTVSLSFFTFVSFVYCRVHRHQRSVTFACDAHNANILIAYIFVLHIDCFYSCRRAIYNNLNYFY